VDLIMAAAVAGRGLCCMPDDHIRPFLDTGQLDLVLEDWCPPLPGYYLYYPSRRQAAPAFSLVLDALSWRG